MEAFLEGFFIVLGVTVAVGIAFFLFVLEPRRKIYDYDPNPPREKDVT